MNDHLKIAVLGAGSWGTTLGVLLNENGHSVTMWEVFEAHVEALLRDRENKKFLPGIPIPDEISITGDLTEALAGAQLILFVVPTHAMREVARSSAATGEVNPDVIVVNASKGIEEGTLKRMSQVLADELPVDPARISSLMGPSHAEEVSRHTPTSVVVAGNDVPTIETVQRVFFRPYFRVYTNPDLIGVELGVALKNSIAIAAGVCDGLEFGDNTKAALITRGLAEIARLGVAMGANRETFSGLAGVGDLVVTCLSRHSRNRHVGEKIGQGQTLDRVLSDMVMVAEGVRTTRAAVALGREHKVELPIIESVHQLLFEDRDPREVIGELMTRPLRQELSGGS
jgi:glycerol-3-phosphate dehydrogenase (NAD(P)+)